MLLASFSKYLIVILVVLISFRVNAESFSGELLKGNLESLEYSRFISEVSKKDVLLFGEQHNHVDMQGFQMSILQSLSERNIGIILSLEAVSVNQQSIVDDFLSNVITLDDFQEKVLLPKGYSDLVMLAKELGVEVVAANANKKESLCIYRHGANYLKATDNAVLDVLYPINSNYEFLIREKLRGDRKSVV